MYTDAYLQINISNGKYLHLHIPRKIQVLQYHKKTWSLHDKCFHVCIISLKKDCCLFVQDLSKPRPSQWFQNSIFMTKCMLQTTDDIALFRVQDNDICGEKSLCFTPLSSLIPTRISFRWLQREIP